MKTHLNEYKAIEMINPVLMYNDWQVFNQKDEMFAGMFVEPAVSAEMLVQPV
jgi:hypothetical protein